MPLVNQSMHPLVWWHIWNKIGWNSIDFDIQMIILKGFFDIFWHCLIESCKKLGMFLQKKPCLEINQNENVNNKSYSLKSGSLLEQVQWVQLHPSGLANGSMHLSIFRAYTFFTIFWLVFPDNVQILHPSIEKSNKDTVTIWN